LCLSFVFIFLRVSIELRRKNAPSLPRLSMTGAEAAGIPNTVIGLRDNLFYKPKDAINRWKSAPDDYGTRRDRHNAIEARNDNLKQQYRCGTDGEDAEACSLVYRSDNKLAPVRKNLNNVSKPAGKGEKVRNAFMRSNRRDDQALDQATKYSNEAENVARSRSK
jgi:hypothetical protein